MVNNLPANAGDADSVPGLERSPARGNGNPLQYSCLENSMDRGAWWAAVHGVSKQLDTTEHMYLLSPSLFPSLDGITAQEMSEDGRESVGQELLFWGLPW